MREYKILLVEDDPADVGLIKKQLEYAGINFSMTEASDEDSFMKAISSEEFDIVLADHSLPNLTSFDILRVCKRLNSKAPFIVVSGIITEEIAVNIIKEGADDYVLKENLKRLPAAIKRAISSSEMQRANAAMETERKFRDVLLENINVGVFAVNNEQEIVLINDTLRKMLGIEVVSPHLKDIYNQFEVFAGDGKTKIPLDNMPLIKALNGEITGNAELVFVNKLSGQKISTRINAQPIYGHDGKITGAVTACHDITRTKKMEEKLKAKIFELDAFIYRTAHDLRGPLTSILGLVAIAKKELKEEMAQLFLDKFDRTAVRLDNILNDLISVTKITRGETNFTKIHLDTLIPALIKRLDNKADRFGVKFVLDLPNRENFLSDRYLIRSIMQNILENSIRYRNHDAENTIISISARHTGSNVQVDITDNGQGIPDDIKDKIFDMFYKGNYASTGSGLGLYITRVAVEKLGGTISVKSKFSKGTTVTITLPLLNEAQVEKLVAERV